MRPERSGSKDVARGVALGLLGAALGGVAGWFLGLGPVGPGTSAFLLSLVGAIAGYSIGTPGGSVPAVIVATCALAVGGLGALLGDALASDMSFVAATIGAAIGFIAGGIGGTMLIAARSRPRPLGERATISRDL